MYMYNRYIGKCVYLLVICLFISAFLTAAFAENTNVTYMGSNVVNAGKDTGYSEKNEIDVDDPHYGWKLGQFVISGYTGVTTDSDGNYVFLKNNNDKAELTFDLVQDINKLNGVSGLRICNDKDGYDQYFQVEKQDGDGMGRGALIVRHINTQNNQTAPQIYDNYLEGVASGDADVSVITFEEGDYEVALDYEIKEERKALGIKLPVFEKYNNYRIFIKFSVRNGDNMVFLFDAKTNSEIHNESVTENGFILNLAGSESLQVSVKRDVWKDSENGLVEDTRFNRIATDGEVFEEEGIYTITVVNQYTGLETVKRIYVGTDSVMKAHFTSGLPMDVIKNQLEIGAEVKLDGTFVPAEGYYIVDSENGRALAYEAPTVTESENTPSKENNGMALTFIIIVVVLLATCGGFWFYRKIIQ